MIKKITAVFTAMIIIITCFSACGEKEKSGKAFAAAVAEMPEHFDPQIAKTTGERMIAVNLFDGLFKPDENGNIVKCAAEDYSISEDGLTYTIRLRDDVKYFVSDSVKKYIKNEDGKVPSKVTADDFVFGITRAILPETDAPFYDLLSSIKNADKVHSGLLPASELGIKAADERTIVITLERKTPDFLYALSQPVSYPCNKEFFELTKGRYGLDTEYTITNGAFYLSSVNEDTSVRIAKNEEYAGSFSAVPSSVGFYVNNNETEVAQKVDNGDYDCGFFASETAKDELGRKVQKVDLMNTTYSLVFNMKKENMQNTSLRNGLVASIDMEAFSDNTANALVSPYYKAAGQPLDANGVEKIPYNVDTARASVKQAFSELQVKNLTVEILCTTDYADEAKKTVSSWQKNIGVELNGTVTAVSNDEFDKKLRAGEYDIVLYPLSIDSDNAVSFLSLFTTDNIFAYSSEEYDRLWGELRNAPNGQKANDCQSHLMKNAVALPLFYDSTEFAVAKDVSGIYYYSDSANVYFYKGQK